MGMLEEIRGSGAGWRQAVALAEGATWDWEDTLFLGSGSSFYLARIAAWLARQRGFRATALPSGEVMLHPMGAGSPRSLVGISRSGATSELLEATRILGLPSLLVTTNPEVSWQGVFTQAVVLDQAGERSIVQTRSFTSALVFFLSVFLGVGATRRLAERLEERIGRMEAEAGAWPRGQRYFLLGTGAAWGLAQEAALKLKETALVQVEAFHTLEFRHGPMSMVDENTVIYLLVPAENGHQERRVGEEMARLGARVVEVGYTLPELPLCLVPFQFLAHQLALEQGLDPERPRHLSYAVRL